MRSAAGSTRRAGLILSCGSRSTSPPTAWRRGRRRVCWTAISSSVTPRSPLPPSARQGIRCSAVTAAEIRETYLSFFEEKGHLRVPSASLIPTPEDTSTLFTIAGMQPLKPYFSGSERPPGSRLTSCQRCFRTPDIEEVGNTDRHLTFFEMLGNFSFGDYFKDEAIAFGWDLSVDGFGFDPTEIWVTVFGGDEEL